MRKFDSILDGVVIFLLCLVLVLTYLKMQVVAVIVTIIAIDLDCFGVWLRRQRKQVEAFIKIKQKAEEDEMLLIDPKALEESLSRSQRFVYKNFYKIRSNH